jgi:hypothetical protein
MNGRVVISRLMRCTVLGAAFFGLSVTAPADPGLSAPVPIKVFDDRYIAGDIAFDDLNYLEKHVSTTPGSGIVLLVCGSKATRALKAAVHRFRHIPVQIRVPDVDEFQCMSPAAHLVSVRQSIGQPPFGIDDEAVERYWRDMMP